MFLNTLSFLRAILDDFLKTGIFCTFFGSFLYHSVATLSILGIFFSNFEKAQKNSVLFFVLFPEISQILKVSQILEPATALRDGW